MEYFLVLICFNALVLGLLVIIFKPLSMFNLKTTAKLGLVSLGLGLSLPLSLLHFNHVTVVLIYGLVVVFFASRLSSSISRLPDHEVAVETSLATPVQICVSADTIALAKGTTGEVVGVPANEGTTTLELVPEPINEVPELVNEVPEPAIELVNEIPDEGDKVADEVIVITVEVIASPDVVVETPFAEPVIISPLEEDDPDAVSLALADEVSVPVDDLLAEPADQALDAEPEPLQVIIDETIPDDTGALMDDLVQAADTNRYEELPAVEELPTIDESPSVLLGALPVAIKNINDDVPGEDLIPDDQEQDIYSMIKAGFDARSRGDTALALGLFIRGLDYSHDPQLSLLMAKEISDIYKESGQYFLAATILRSLTDSGSGLSLPERKVLLEHAVYLEQMETN